MRCRKCGQKAVINMPEHRLALCKEHYLEWLPIQVERWIKHYGMFAPGARVLVAVSGGKDSLSLWDMLYRLGYHPDGLYIHLGIRGSAQYSEQSLKFATRFAKARGLNLKVAKVIPSKEDELVRNIMSGLVDGRPCATCGITKRHIMNEAAVQGGYDAIATGHNLDDEAAVLFGNTLTWSTEQLARQAPVLPAADGFALKVKPLCRIAERETAAYALLSGIEYVYDECPFSEGNQMLYYKTVLDKIEADRPGTKLKYYLSYLQARDNGFFTKQNDPMGLSLNHCPRCGQPTTSTGLCAYCRSDGDEVSIEDL
jgi:uncharacterized protein (TIGR00269 family)